MVGKTKTMPARFSKSQKSSACLPEKLPQLLLLSQKMHVPHDILTDKLNVVAIKLCYVSFLCIWVFFTEKSACEEAAAIFSHNCVCFREQTDVGLKFIMVFINPIGI